MHLYGQRSHSRLILFPFLLAYLPLAVSKTPTKRTFGFSPPSNMKRDSPSAQRNKDPIWEILSSRVLPSLSEAKDEKLRVLEVAAGCGVHTEYFATNIASTHPLIWYPTDPTPDSRASIQCYIADIKLGNVVQAPLSLTLNEKGIIEKETLSIIEGPLDLILCINMIHISPWEATLGLMKVAGETLSDEGFLYTYGPYKVGGTAADSNLSFDRSLKSRDSSWGVRNLEDVCSVAEEQGLKLVGKYEMPANNLSLLFQKQSS
jgi:hypothetical protein